MLARGTEILAKAVAEHSAVPAFATYNLEMVHVMVPLVLHGASGLPDEQLSGAIRCDVAKININTELRQAYLAAVVSVLPSVLATHDSVALWRAGREAVTTAAVRSIYTLANSHQQVANTS